MERRLLESEEVQTRLAVLNGWEAREDKLVKKMKFANFAEALEFVNKVGALAEDADHHPDITFGWGYAEIALTTHDRGGITDADFALAMHIDAI